MNLQTTFYFVRHGTVENPKHVIYGRGDYPLSEDGRVLIESDAHILKPFYVDVIYGSPVLRSVQTAEILQQKLGVPFFLDDRLTESEIFSAWEGKTIKEVAARFPKEWRLFKNSPAEYQQDGLSVEIIAERMHDFLLEKQREHSGKKIVCVSHGDPIKLLVCKLEGRPYNDIRTLSLNYGGIIEVRLCPDVPPMVVTLFIGTGDFSLNVSTK